MMPGNLFAGHPLPFPSSPLPPVQPENPTPQENPEGSHRDDNAPRGPQNYQIQELHFQYSLPNPYGGPLMEREFHGYLATPNTSPLSAGIERSWP